MAKGGTSAEWDGPVAMQGKAIRDIKKCIRSFLSEGPLRRSIRAAASSFGTGDTLEVWSSLPYSKIQDQGGFIPPFSMPAGQRRMVRHGYGQRLSRQRYGRVMVFSAGGKTIFTRHRRGFTLRAKNFVQKGVDMFMPGVKIEWVDHGRSSKGFIKNAV